LGSCNFPLVSPFFCGPQAERNSAFPPFAPCCFVLLRRSRRLPCPKWVRKLQPMFLSYFKPDALRPRHGQSNKVHESPSAFLTRISSPRCTFLLFCTPRTVESTPPLGIGGFLKKKMLTFPFFLRLCCLPPFLSFFFPCYNKNWLGFSPPLCALSAFALARQDITSLILDHTRLPIHSLHLIECPPPPQHFLAFQSHIRDSLFLHRVTSFQNSCLSPLLNPLRTPNDFKLS